MENYEMINNYKDISKRMLQLSFPYLSNKEIEEALNYSINKRFKNQNTKVHNSYKKTEVDTTLAEVTDYILKREPIITAFGTMFKKHAEGDNPIAELLRSFMEGRDVYKKEMFKHPKGSEQFEKYNLLQLLSKLDANASYGAMAAPTCILFNAYVASSITTQGRSLISAASLTFEAFLANNVDFRSLNEIITFIDNVCQEKDKRTYNDNDFLDRNITLAEAFNKVMMSCGFGYIPTEDDLNIVWEIMMRLSQEDLNRIYYKNNLFDFMDNKTPLEAIVVVLKKLNDPFMDPNHLPKEIEVELHEFWLILREYVFYNHQYIDRIDRMKNMIRKVSIINDTDSAIVSLDAWYNFIMQKVKDIPLTIRYRSYALDYFDQYDNGEMIPKKGIEYLTENEVDYDFMNEEIVMKKRAINPLQIIPPDGLRFTIINIIAYCMTQMANEYLEQFTKQSNSWAEDRKCLIYLKNEFLFKRVLFDANAKKRYASNVELQEGNIIPNSINEKLDIKGFDALKKSTTNDSTKHRLKEIIYEDILDAREINQITILKKLAILKEDIYNSLASGKKDFYKPAVIKSQDNYADPIRIQGIKASMVYNSLKNDDEVAIDLTKRNSIDIVKVDLNKKTVDKIKDSFPLVYDRALELLEDDTFSKTTAIAIPYGEPVPEWVIPFIDYTTIINDNLTGFPLQSCGLQFSTGKNNYTNIIKF